MPSNEKTFYSAHTVLFIIAIIACITTWLIPAGQYDRIEYQKSKNKFVLQGKDSTIYLPATQNTLSKLGLNIEIQNFTEGKIFKPISVPNSYHTLEKKPQGVIEFLQAFIKGFYSAIEVILLVLVIGGLIGIVNATGAFKGLNSIISCS